MSIRIVRNSAGNCVNFVGSSNPVYWNACLSAEEDPGLPGTVNVINDVRTLTEGTTQYEFYQLPFENFERSDGTTFASASECASYITAESNVASNTGQFVLSDSDQIDFRLDQTGTTILLLDNGDAYAVNSIRAAENDSGHIDILRHTGDTIIYKDLRLHRAYINEVQVTQVLATAVNELNALFLQSGSSSGSAPVITSATTVNITSGDTINYELIATNGVGYEWSNLPSGVVTVDGNVRKIIGGSGLTTGTYNVTAKAVNYFGEDTKTITFNVSDPPYSNTKSVNFQNLDYLGAHADLLEDILGRSSDGSGSGDAWTIAFWFKGSTNTNGQTIFYFGNSDVTNGGFIELKFAGAHDRLRLRYGSNNNFIQLNSPTNSIPAGTWTHCIVTYDGGSTGSSSGSLSSYYGRFSICINGVQVTTSNSHSNYGYTGNITGHNLRVGRFSSGNYMRDDCRVDEIAVWGSDQYYYKSDIYNSGNTHDLSTLSNPPDHWWRMGDGDTYPVIQDNIGSAHFVMYNQTAADIVNDVP